MYAKLEPLRRDATLRLRSLAEYTASGYAVFVPVALIELWPLARRFPIVWRSTEGGSEIGALLFLTSGHGPVRARFLAEGQLPLLVEAYPLALSDTVEDRSAVLIDDVPLGPGGEAVFGPDGRTTEAGARRLSALQIFANDVPRARASTAVLEEAGLIEDWPVRLAIAGDSVELEGLRILTRNPRLRAGIPALAERHGFAVAQLATLHDLSLFNMQRLVDFHRSERLFAAAGRPA